MAGGSCPCGTPFSSRGPFPLRKQGPRLRDTRRMMFKAEEYITSRIAQVLHLLLEKDRSAERRIYSEAFHLITDHPA
jgi:hypothetical protein